MAGAMCCSWMFHAPLVRWVARKAVSDSRSQYGIPANLSAPQTVGRRPGRQFENHQRAASRGGSDHGDSRTVSVLEVEAVVVR